MALPIMRITNEASLILSVSPHEAVQSNKTVFMELSNQIRQFLNVSSTLNFVILEMEFFNCFVLQTAATML